MLLRNYKSALLSLAIVSLLGATAVSTSAEARERQDRKSSQKEENRYPDATREEPKVKGSPKVQKKLQSMCRGCRIFWGKFSIKYFSHFLLFFRVSLRLCASAV